MTTTYRNEMATDAIAAHLGGHCTEDAPCSTLTKLLQVQGGKGLSARAHGHELATPRHGSGHGHGHAAAPVSGFGQASPRQVELIQKLAAELGMDVAKIAGITTLTSGYGGTASKLIDRLIDMSKAQRVQAVDAKRRAALAAKPELEAGIYLVDGLIYKVQKAVHGSGRMYAKLLDVEAARFEFAPGAIAKIQPEHRMTLEQAKEFGQVYGVCCNCGATLTDEDSIAAGIGPVCAKKF